MNQNKMTEKPIEVEGISRSYGSLKAIENLSFDVKDKEIFGIIGPDGAGKTSLLRILATLILPDSGTARIKGYDVVKDFRKIRSMIGYMPGRFSLYQDLTVKENLNFYSKVFGTDLKENYDLIEDIYHQIEPFKHRKAGQLSGGMKQKLALSCALIHRPEILILDEPTTGVDAVSRREFWNILERIKNEGIPSIVSTPYMDEVSLCDRVALMQDGRILSLDVPERINDSYTRPLFSVRSTSSLFEALQELRNMEWTHSAWLFGQEIHLSLVDEKSVPAFEEAISENHSIKIQRIRAGIEDSFIELMGQKNE